jgi:hypothetical protein
MAGRAIDAYLIIYFVAGLMILNLNIAEVSRFMVLFHAIAEKTDASR